ncbi:hypothetical protein [Lactococcus lactis]|uniref:hypothetical protein n=1 Tax=Lactococcus lactis TaxID=1358 RepID=UPI0037C0D295
MSSIEGKSYLFRVLDGFNSEILSYKIPRSPNLEQIKVMLEETFAREQYEGTILLTKVSSTT